MEFLLGYEYLVGGLILFIIWLAFFLLRKDLRKLMIWSSSVYFVLFIVGMIALPVINNFIPPERAFNPGYWQPRSLWNLNQLTGGAGVEDGFFMFFLGGIAAVIYEIVFRKKVGRVKNHGYHLHAFRIGVIAALLFVLFFNVNLIWFLIIFGFVSAFIEVLERKDLYGHAVWGGITFLFVYLIAFKIFLLIYPDFIADVYNLENLTGVLLLGLPMEEILYALSFGVMWAPLYEYVMGAKDRN